MLSSPFASPSGRAASSYRGNGTSGGGPSSPQHQNHHPPTTNGSPRPRETEREKAKREAKECLRAVGHEGFQLDGFNLLGVVANPRAGMMGSSRHNIPAEAPPPTDEEPAESDMFTDAVQSLESTLGQVTEQIETLNLFLEELSRQYLGDDGGETLFLEYYYQDEDNQLEIPAVPPQLANVRLTELQAYLERSGVLAHSLFAQGLSTSSLPPGGAAAATASPSSKCPSWNDPVAIAPRSMNLGDHHDDIVGEAAPPELFPEIPEIFHEAGFDLTDSDTFLQLLLQDAAEASTASYKPSNSRSDSLYQPTHELVPARDQEALAGHLDRVELALQEQVRLKAGAFFQETTRFRQLQSSISELLDQVQTLRRGIKAILDVYSRTTDISAHQRRDYEQFIELMDAAMELVQTKASIGGLLSANDHLGAAQQIQYGRRLLRGETAAEGDGDASVPSGAVELQHMTALSTCGEQFEQYESLVVQNLSEEIVDAFFHWRAGEKERVQEMVEALNLCRALSKAGDLYLRRLQQTVRMTVRTTIAEFVESSGSSTGGVTGMTYPDFYGCLELLIEELQTVLQVASDVDEFCERESILPGGEKRWTNAALVSGADLATKSIAELLRLRKEAHSLISLDEMRQLWDTCLRFTLVMEGYGNNTKAVGLRSTLVGQAKAFLDRTHESHMTSLVAALDSERWTPCEVSSERQAALTRLCTGRAIVAVRRTQEESTADVNAPRDTKHLAEVEGVQYKVVWSCLLLVEMVMTNLSAAAHFQSLATNAVAKVAELLRLFNTRATHLVLGAGAIHSAARLKSINAKHLSMVTQCLGMMTSLLPHVRAALMAQLPPKQHTLLNDLDKIKKDYTDHLEKVLNKFVNIIGGIVEHGLAPRISNTNFDARARDLPVNENELACCVFLDGVATNTKKMHQVLNAMLPPDHLQDVFSRIFAYVDQKVPTLLIAASTAKKGPNGVSSFQFPTTDEGKRRLLSEVELTTKKLNGLAGVLPWDFTCVNIMERRLDFKLEVLSESSADDNSPSANTEDAEGTSEDAETNDESHHENHPKTERSEATSEPLPDSVEAVNDSPTADKQMDG